MTDWAETLDGLRAGDLAATNSVIALITRYLASTGAFKLRDSWDDLVQEVLMTLLQKPPRSREPGAIVRHIQTTTYRRYIDEIRRIQGRKRKDGEGDAGGAWRRNVALDEALELAEPEDFWSRQMDLGVRGALDRLEAPQRRALVAVYLTGFTYDEAAAHLGVPLGTLKGQLREGLARLRAMLLEKDEASPSDSGRSSDSLTGGVLRERTGEFDE